jgi:phage anti-repressor protein
MDTRNLTDLDPATLAALAKTAADAAKATREELPVGVHTVDTILTLVLGAEVKVLEDQEGVLTPQKAKPWGLVHVLLEEVNKMRNAAGLAGIDIAKVVAMAEKADKSLVKKAQEDADKAMAELKEPTRSSRKGAVKVKGDAKLPA